MEIKCILDGKLNISLRGIDYIVKGNRVPINVNFTKFTINGEKVFNESKIIHHDSPFVFEKDVSDKEICKLYFEWMPV